MRDNYKLLLIREFFQETRKTRHIHIVQGGVNFVKDAKTPGTGYVNCKEKGNEEKASFSAGEGADILGSPARKLNLNLNARCGYIGWISKAEAGKPASKEANEELVELALN